ncbi:MAG: DUF2461 domain-containing protein, partial [Catalinimonas sp.]
NKQPYKTQFGAFLAPAALGAPGGRKSTRPGYYLHLEPGDRSFAGGGLYHPERDVLRRVRQEIDYDGAKLRAVLDDRTFREHFPTLEGDRLLRPPKGYMADHPDVELLKHKDFVVTQTLTDAAVKRKDLAACVEAIWRVQKPFNDFLDRAAAEA